VPLTQGFRRIRAKRLQPGELIEDGGELWRVKRVNDCRALIVPVAKDRREFTTVEGRTVAFESTRRPANISPYSLVRRINEKEQDREADRRAGGGTGPGSDGPRNRPPDDTSNGIGQDCGVDRKGASGVAQDTTDSCGQDAQDQSVAAQDQTPTPQADSQGVSVQGVQSEVPGQAPNRDVLPADLWEPSLPKPTQEPVVRSREATSNTAQAPDPDPR